jgi:hypothetical protein
MGGIAWEKFLLGSGLPGSLAAEAATKPARHLQKLAAITAKQFVIPDMTRHYAVRLTPFTTNDIGLLTQKPAVLGMKRHI